MSVSLLRPESWIPRRRRRRWALSPCCWHRLARRPGRRELMDCAKGIRPSSSERREDGGLSWLRQGGRSRRRPMIGIPTTEAPAARRRRMPDFRRVDARENGVRRFVSRREDRDLDPELTISAPGGATAWPVTTRSPRRREVGHDADPLVGTFSRAPGILDRAPSSGDEHSADRDARDSMLLGSHFAVSPSSSRCWRDARVRQTDDPPS